MHNYWVRNLLDEHPKPDSEQLNEVNIYYEST